MKNLEQTLKRVKSISWSKGIVSFYIVKRVLVSRKAKYKIFQVNIDDKLKVKLRKIASNKVKKSNQALEYDFNTKDLDDNVLGICTNETDLQAIIDSITGVDKLHYVKDYKELIGAWFYIARVDFNNRTLYSIQKVSDSWTTKRISNIAAAIFQDNMLIDLDKKEIFRIDGNIDFFSFDGVIFIANKQNFENGLNFRTGMENNRDKIVKEFKKIDLFVDADEISRLVGNNIKRLRKLSQVKRSGYYKDKAFLAGLKVTIQQEKWNIKYSSEGKIIITEEDLDDVLTVLNNDRLTSKVNKEDFDVDGKHKFK